MKLVDSPRLLVLQSAQEPERNPRNLQPEPPMLQALRDFFFPPPTPKTDAEFYADVCEWGNKRLDRSGLMVKYGIATHAAYRRKLARVCRKLQVPLPDPAPRVTRSRAVHYVGKHGIAVPQALCEEAGFIAGDAIEIVPRGDVLVLQPFKPLKLETPNLP